jgi:cobalt-zinc-cadmium efflux system protein
MADSDPHPHAHAHAQGSAGAASGRPTLPSEFNHGVMNQSQGLHAHGAQRGHHDAHRRGHSHGHSHRHPHGPSENTSSRALLFGIALNGAFATFEFATGWMVSSTALKADALHNFGDVAGLVLAWAGLLATRKKPNARHTYGWRRGTIVAAFFNALLMLLAMGWLAAEAFERFASPVPTDGYVMMLVAGMGIFVNGVTAWMLKPGSDRDLNLKGAYLHMITDALVSLGVVVAGLLVMFGGWVWADPLTSLLITVVVFVGTWRLFRQSLHLMFDGVPESINMDHLRQTLLSMPGITHVDDLHVWALGTTQSALTAHLVAPLGTSGDEFLRQAVRTLQEQHGIAHVTLQITRNHLGMSCQPPQRGEVRSSDAPPVRPEPLRGASA